MPRKTTSTEAETVGCILALLLYPIGLLVGHLLEKRTDEYSPASLIESKESNAQDGGETIIMVFLFFAFVSCNVSNSIGLAVAGTYEHYKVVHTPISEFLSLTLFLGSLFVVWLLSRLPFFRSSPSR